jgi:hypothetical protein
MNLHYTVANTLKKRNQPRRIRGSSIIETAVGCIVLIPVFLFLVDAISVVVAQTANDSVCKECARAAADIYDSTKPQPSTTQAAIQSIVNQHNSASNKFTFYTLTYCDSPDGWQTVRCNTNVKVTMPIPVPFSNLNNLQFAAQSVEPVVTATPVTSGS